MADKQQLIDMGFAPERVDWALRATGGKGGLQGAMDHLVEHSEDAVPSAAELDAAHPPGGSGGSGGGAGDGDEEGLVIPGGPGSTAASIKCADCGKAFRSQAYASFHAEKSGHTNFEESTEAIAPLTEEERKARLEEMREKLKEKRAKQAVLDKEEQKANELIRRKAGKETLEAKESLKAKEAEKEAARKRAEKAEEIAARARVKAQIEADKRERAAKAAEEKARREGRADPAVAAAGSSAGTSAAAAAAAPAPSAAGASASDARLRVRLDSGGQWVGVLPANSSTLRDVERAVLESGSSAGPRIRFSTTFPRKVFGDEDAGKSLRELGLVPNAALEGRAYQ